MKNNTNNTSNGSKDGGVASANGLEPKAIGGYRRPRSLREKPHDATALSSPLTDAQQQALDACEDRIRRGWDTFVDVGRALAQIRDDNLYKGRYETFDDYCHERWQYGRHYAYRLINAAAAYDGLLTIVNTDGGKPPLPESEAQVRPLVGLEAKDAKKAWLKAAASANGHGITARLVKQAAADFAKPKPSDSPRKQPGNRKVPKRRAALKEALRLLDKIREAVSELKVAEQTLGLLKQARNCLLELRDSAAERTQDKGQSRGQEKQAA